MGFYGYIRPYRLCQFPWLQGKVIIFYIVGSGIHNHLQLSVSIRNIMNGHIKTESIFHIAKGYAWVSIFIRYI